MPLLFKNGKLIINDIDQLVFSDDPDSCRCCPGLCECPSGSDYATPKYLDDISFQVSGFPSSYTENKTERYREIGQVLYTDTTFIQELELTGWDQLNGTYPGSLVNAVDLVTECTPPDPVPECPYDDTRASCRWVVNYPTVVLSGSLRLYYLRVGNETGQQYRIETDDTYYAYGFATIFQTTDSPGIPRIRASARGCFSTSPYGEGTILRNWAMDFWDISNTNPSDAIIYNLTETKQNCDGVYDTAWVFPDQAVRPVMLLNTQNPAFLGPGECYGGITTIGGSSFPWTFCNEPGVPDAVDFDFPACSSSGSLSGSFLAPLFNRFFDYSYDTSAFSFQYQWNPTILP